MAISSTAASAAIIDLLPTGGTFISPPGSSRGVVFTADTSFSITSIGIFLEPQFAASIAGKEFDLLVVNGDSLSGAGGTLGTSKLSFVPTQDGFWYDTELSFSFSSSNQYSLVWRSSDASNLLPVNMTLYSDDDFPTAIGPFLTLNAGRSGITGGNVNGFVPNFRFNAIPEPAGWVLLAVMSTGLLILPRQRRA